MAADYYRNYLKYKSKYLALKSLAKSQTGGAESAESYVSKLKQLYPVCTHDRSGSTLAEYTGYSTTYGEMDYDSIEKINTILNPTRQLKHFIDFGSGRSKLVLYMATKVDKSIGVELVKSRHDDAVKFKNELSKRWPDITAKVELVQGDMFEYLKDVKFDSPVLIWVSNLCFDADLTKKLFDVLAEKLPAKSIICSSRVPQVMPNRLVKHEKDGLGVPMSWSKDSSIHIYTITA